MVIFVGQWRTELIKLELHCMHFQHLLTSWIATARQDWGLNMDGSSKTCVRHGENVLAPMAENPLLSWRERENDLGAIILPARLASCNVHGCSLNLIFLLFPVLKGALGLHEDFHTHSNVHFCQRSILFHFLFLFYFFVFPGERSSTFLERHTSCW